ncbi:acinetobactin biosynthesis thioesterase BasH [Acinetobacter baumannii]|uniref:acinetobactin biosynthesis thioesterase BasH n=1 Tax=Acinetobacter baumannii TaxID=470 RepID=UPI00112CC346|nr:acinetobactin biosynthesis thioesterase BasH [Acinetobacter baumannii]EKX9889223.1 acinetobactin biosynthesis thioesterase BasH [Acinetobacter baumannii]ELA9134660.1 acinetobactin biosynthesis thioesterase BasH [Acinetobacter baumannii]ELA9138228.1 acinetobactin biosynthesis thioesterase BasH [Acinetobacter baumannii]ELW9268386.1 acinetobactin biosynthesis thioesterase BasH [Acinetobacter baumannii]ELW9271833.1 acinetobactin biosynthesis thioesterase BasH [Acinetobacter baumannii]
MDKHQYNMFCLPPAGSSASIYHPWKKRISDNIRIIPIEYSGHGIKINEPLIDDPDLLAMQIANEIQAYSDKPFILFGHSVGGGLIWKVLNYLNEKPIIDQLRLIVISSRPEHHYIQHMRYKHELTDEKIIDELKRYNNFPDEILNNQDALTFFLKIIRNDFYLSDQLLGEKIHKTEVPIVAFYGKQDPDIPNKRMMDAWQQHTENWLGSIEFEGDHFYFLNPETRVKMLENIAAIVETLTVNIE